MLCLIMYFFNVTENAINFVKKELCTRENNIEITNIVLKL